MADAVRANNKMMPPELDIVGCWIETSYGTGGKVIKVTGPWPPEPDWYARPLLGGWAIEYERDGRRFSVNEVFVEDGRIYAHPWRDEIRVVGGLAQLSLFCGVASDA